MRFGIFDQNDWTGRPVSDQYGERIRLAQLYERCGFYSYLMSEHHGTPLSVAPSPSVMLAALSQRTTTLRLGALVFNLPMYQPMRLVEEICMLDHLSGGRLQVGIGRGASPFELGYLGAAPEAAADMYAEAFAFLKQGLTEGRLDGRGRHWSYDDVDLSLRPVQMPHPPFWYAAASADSAVWPAENGINVVCGGPPDGVRSITDRYRAVRAGRGAAAGADEPLLGITRHIVVAETDGEARRLAERAWPTFHEHFMRLWVRHGAEPRNMKLPPSIAPLLASGFAVAGSPATVRQALCRQVEAGGVDYLSGSFAFGDLGFDEVARSVRLFASDVMPAVRDAHRTAHRGLAPAA